MKGQTKSRSGCLACKAKRLKCDEARPGCCQCRRRGITCPGYRKPLKWSQKYHSGDRHATAEPPDFTRLISEASQSVQQGEECAVQLPPTPSHIPSSQCSDADGGAEPSAHHPVSPSECVGLVGSGSILDQHLMEPATMLIELWFKSVCGAWAAYDSPLNPFRCMGSSLWGSSKPLFYSLQSMAAASVPKPRPEICQVAISAPKLATQALIDELARLFEDVNVSKAFPRALLMSLFCMSSSVSWMDHRQLGLQYLGHARNVITLFEMRLSLLSPEEQELLQFFKGCLLYEEAVRSVVTSCQDNAPIGLLLPGPPDSGLVFHSWTGVPPSIIGVFGKTMELCRKSRDMWRGTPIATYDTMRQAMEHISEGQTLEEALLSIEVPDPPNHQEKNHHQAVESHLHFAAEAFRFGSLLQLYQTFPDLVSRRLPRDIDANGRVPRACLLIPLALHITGLLTKIPHDSGMRCLQPLLCLCAGTGLRCEVAPHEGAASELLSLVTDASSSRASPSRVLAPQQQSLSIILAREFLLNRLQKLERGLPAKPVVVLQSLLQAVWTCYDGELDGDRHWLDIMVESKYESVFG